MRRKYLGFAFLALALVAAIGLAVSGQGGLGFVTLIIIVLMAAPFFRPDKDPDDQ